MQKKSNTSASRRSNLSRTQATRAALLAAARRLFIDKGYAETGTPEIVAAAGVTRGALYHHFADKQALFRAVVEQEAVTVAEQIEQATPASLDAEGALLEGGRAFLRAMAVAGRTRLLLLDGPAVLGMDTMTTIDATTGGRALREGVAYGVERGELAGGPTDALAAILSAAFDRAALAIEAGGSAADYEEALALVIRGLTRAEKSPKT